MIKICKWATRTVIVLKKYVIKFPTFKTYELFLNGLLANIQEKKFSGTHKDLAKVKYCNKYGLFLLMEKANVLPNSVDYNDFLKYLKDKYRNDDMKSFMLSDMKVNNWGYINNRIVKIDYGN